MAARIFYGPRRPAAQKAYREFKQPLQAAFYAGPYVILCRYLAEPSAGNILFRDVKSHRPLPDAEISCQFPGSRFTGWRVPWLLLNGRLLHGYRLLLSSWPFRLAINDVEN